ncbi:hypothetical protein ACFSCZ_10655 [Siminovitchia sediminis]|uniref:Uncharacterized protein n=1 Tax=Siminovitchia sediminis TaxID=1274353 RepID=A0ABW4KGF6_9BACI
MPRKINELKRISDALYSSSEMLQKESMPESVRKSLEEAEERLNQAIYHALSNKSSIGQK